jgi:hypothetical protein
LNVKSLRFCPYYFPHLLSIGINVIVCSICASGIYICVIILTHFLIICSIVIFGSVNLPYLWKGRGSVEVNGSYLSRLSNSAISSSLAIRFIDDVVISRNRAIDAPVYPNFRTVSPALVCPKITPLLTPCQVLCLFLFPFAPTSPSVRLRDTLF